MTALSLLQVDAVRSGDGVLIWIGVALLFAVIVGFSLLYALLSRTRLELEALSRLEGIENIEEKVGKIVEHHGLLDLRRLEHVLIDIRDGQRRSEERLLSLVESLNQTQENLANAATIGTSGGPPLNAVHISSKALSERIVSRLLALGFERVEVLASLDELDELLEQDGEVRVEARRTGALHKGRVFIRDGSIADVQLRAAYEVFP